MTTRVLVIPEDFRNDQYILSPLVTAMLTHLGKPNATVRVCMDPLLGGVSQAMDKGRLAEIFDRYGSMVDLFVLCVDKDCDEGRRASLDERETWAMQQCDCILVAESAWQEIEVWVLAGHILPEDWSWQEVRAECNPKELYFEPFAAQRGVTSTPGGGRKMLANEAASRYSRIKQFCPEDFAALERRLEQMLDQML